MTKSATSFRRSKVRSYGLASVLALGFGMMASVPGCLDENGSSTANECQPGQTDPTTATDCVRKECQAGRFVAVPNDVETPDDVNPCTQDTCVGGEAKNVPVNGTSCQLGAGVGQCVAGQCEIPCMGEGECNDENQCTDDACVGMVCMFVANNGTIPDDLNPCTNDACAAGQESHAPATNQPCGMNGTCNDMGVCIGCGADSDCPPDDFCSDWTCSNKQCVAAPQNEGMPLPASDQSPGDCKLKVCQGGGVVTNADASDPFDDGNACTANQCSDTTPVNPPEVALTACPSANNPTGTGKCDGNGVCLGCTQTSECGPGPMWHTCDVAVNTCFSCSDMMQNGTETDVDCGGECIDRCERDQKCIVTSDCEGECDNKVCVDCFDNTKNGTEGDVDCGGSCVKKCDDGDTCGVGADCFSGVCNAGTCAPPSCTDVVQNGGETDVDCGGPGCPDCVTGKKCVGNNDCVNDCIDSICN